MSAPKTRDEKFLAEHTRQTVAFSDAIDAAINDTGRQFAVPMINSVATAIVMAEAQLLASVSDPTARQALLDAMNEMRPAAYAKCGSTMRVELIVTRGDEVLQ